MNQKLSFNNKNNYMKKYNQKGNLKIVDKNMNTINDNTIITVRNSKDSELKNQMY